MAYKTKIHHKRLPKNYFRDVELKNVQEKNRKHFSVERTIREGERYAYDENDKTHKVGQAVDIDGRIGVVTKVSKKGVHIQEYTSNKGFFTPTTKKPKFIKEKDYEGRAKPFYTSEAVSILYNPANVFL